MKTIIAEKPSVAREIARIVGATKREEGYFEGGGYAVTWAFGHLVQLAMPDGYGIRGFVRDNLPVIPVTFSLIPRQVRAEKGYKTDSGAAAQIKVIERLFRESGQIIVATDAGREGELIFRYLYHYTGCTTPFVRLWISSLTDKAIREGLSNLEEGGRYDNLYLAAKARSESDWLVGINGTQALSVAAGHGTYSVGRVQTPTLAMVCERYRENKRFTPETFRLIHIAVDGRDGKAVKLTSSEKWKEKEEVTGLYDKVKKAGSATVTKVLYKEKTEEAPLLYDLTTLQKEANTKHGFTAEQTLEIVQKLYEKRLVTYPRTGSRHIPEDVFAEIPGLLSFIGSMPEWKDKVQPEAEPCRQSDRPPRPAPYGREAVVPFQRGRYRLPHDRRAHDRGVLRAMRQGYHHRHGGVCRSGVHGERLCYKRIRMACSLWGRGQGRACPPCLAGRRHAAAESGLHDGGQDQAQTAAYRSHPTRGDGNGGQGYRR